MADKVLYLSKQSPTATMSLSTGPVTAVGGVLSLLESEAAELDGLIRSGLYPHITQMFEKISDLEARAKQDALKLMKRPAAKRGIFSSNNDPVNEARRVNIMNTPEFQALTPEKKKAVLADAGFEVDDIDTASINGKSADEIAADSAGATTTDEPATEQHTGSIFAKHLK